MRGNGSIQDVASVSHSLILEVSWVVLFMGRERGRLF